MLQQGDINAPIMFLTDTLGVNCRAEGKVFSEYLGAPLYNALSKAGIRERDYGMVYYANQVELKQVIASSSCHIVVPLGEQPLRDVTGLVGISKWQCSVVTTTAELGGRKCLPLYHPEHIMKFWSDHVFLVLGCQKLLWEKHTKRMLVPERTFHTNLNVNDAIRFLHEEVLTASVIGVDFEFSQGQINTVGFAVSRTEAIAIKTLSDDFTLLEHHALWCAIAEVLESNVPKVIQHAATEVTWAARYGIQINNIIHDTMWAMKFLYPEFDKGLDNVGRFFTPFPYWKDDNDSWTNIRDWQRHLTYNCKDTTATLWAYQEQKQELKARKLDKLFNNFVMKFQPVIQEMCVTGLGLNPHAVLKLKEETERDRDNFQRIIDQECQLKLSRTINPRSPKQLKDALQEMGMVLPKKKAKGQDEAKISTDKKSLVKLRRKHPEEHILPALIGLSAANKKLSSYVDFSYDQQTNRVYYTLDGCGTETGRWAGYGASWGDGFNPQTVPKSIRKVFVADPGTIFVQIDLKQAESRYVAWDGPDAKFMELLESGQDIHRYVAGQIFKKPEQLVTDMQRQLGKKAGHASNYGTGPRTFAEMALTEMNYFLEESEAKDILEGYMRAFPGVRRRQERIKKELYQQRMLCTPLGRERHFYGRMDDGTFREAFAYCPQSTIPDITNCLMLKLWDNREYIGLSYDEGGRFLLQVHDSLLLQCKPQRLGELIEFVRDIDQWHPRIELSGGRLRIPTDIEYGNDWKNMTKI
jgi:DNA polymerase I